MIETFIVKDTISGKYATAEVPAQHQSFGAKPRLHYDENRATKIAAAMNKSATESAKTYTRLVALAIKRKVDPSYIKTTQKRIARLLATKINATVFRIVIP